MKIRILLVIAALTAGSLNADPADWQELSIKQTDSVWASSSLKEMLNGKEITYGPEALFDGNTASPWVEGASGGGTGESILVLTRKMVNSLVLTNGFASSPRLFTRNNRIKNMKVAFVAGLTAPGLVSEMDYYLYFTREKLMPDSFLLEDLPEPQNISLAFSEGVQNDFYRGVIREFAADFPDFYVMILRDLGIPPEESESLMYQKLIMEMYGFFAIRISIGEIYKGSHYDDTCLAELSLELEEF